MSINPPGWPRRTDCIRPGCGHSSDVHRYDGTLTAGLSVTESTTHWPCTECECRTMLRSAENYAQLILEPGRVTAPPVRHGHPHRRHS